MPNLLQKSGAQPSKQPRFGVLWHNNFYLGVVTQRNPLHSFLQHIEEEFYGSQPCLIDGLNTEISTKLTIIRRPGSSVYNSNTFPSVNRFYSNRTSVYNSTQTSSTEQIQVLADTAATIYQVSGAGPSPSSYTISEVQNITHSVPLHGGGYRFVSNIIVTFTTAITDPVGSLFSFSGLTSYTALNGETLPSVYYSYSSLSSNQVAFNGSSFLPYGPSPDTGTATVQPYSAIFSKSLGAGSTYFQSVGNSLYLTDGVDQKKYLTPSYVWGANQSFQLGSYVLDPMGNLQVVESAFTLSIESVIVLEVSSTWYMVVQFNAPAPWATSTNVTFNGLTGYTAANGNTYAVQGAVAGLNINPNQAAFLAPTSSNYGPTEDSGTGTSQPSATQYVSGTTVPTWKETLRGFTADGNLLWTNFGPQLENWGIFTPTNLLTVTPNPNNRQWSPNYSYSGSGYDYYTIIDPNGNVQLLYQGIGPTGSEPPSWSTQIPVFQFDPITSGVVINTPGGLTVDGGYSWLNCGIPQRWVANSYPAPFSCVLDSNGNWEIATGWPSTGYSTGATQPTWPALNSTVSDGAYTWLNCGPGYILATGMYDYAFSAHGVDGSVSTASSTTLEGTGSGVVGTQGNYLYKLTGTPYTTDTQQDQIWLWRTVQGGSTLFFLDSFPYTSISAGSFTYYDYLTDSLLDEFIEAPIDDQNNPPPVGLTAIAYHLNRVWGAVGNIVYSSQTSGIVGNPYTAWDPESFFEFPSTVIRLWPTANGLIVFTNSSPYVIQGLGDSSSSFFSTPFLQNVGLANYDAFDVNGAVAYMYTTDNQVMSMDPSSGFSEVGFPIGDQFGPNNGLGTFTPYSAFLTWHFQGSQEKALYVSDRTGNWWRMLPTPSPETGTTWCPLATIVGGFSAVQSVETSPGVHTLLMGPSSSGPILKRDLSVFSDNGSPYNAYSIVGSLVLAQPGQLAYAKLITTDSQAVGTPITLKVQLDEIAPVTSGYFENLTLFAPDPTQLSPSASVYAQRFYLSQTQQPAVCRHMQIAVEFGTDTVKNELLSLTVYGSFDQEN